MLTDQEIEGLALAHEDYGFGQVGSDGVSAHGFDAPGVLAFARAIEQAATAPLLARIAELEAELEKTKAIFAASCNHAAVMEMERDARRYRWLRKRWARLDESYADGCQKITSLRALTDQEVKDGYGWDVDPDSLDRAIDAAIAKATGQKGEES